jgi:predicted RNA-binding Zn-ribbon protein involved in translation (DUF1610 family)
MEIRYHCPQCGSDHHVACAEESTLLDCPRCGYVGLLPADWNRDGHVERCPICGHSELYRQKDFNHRVGIAILIAGGLLVLPTRYISLVFAAILDLILYLTAPEVLICYTCRTQIRGHRPTQEHGRFDPRIEATVRKEQGRTKGRVQN